MQWLETEVKWICLNLLWKKCEMSLKAHSFWRVLIYLKPLWSTEGAPMHIGSALAGFKKAFEAYIYRMRPASK